MLRRTTFTRTDNLNKLLLRVFATVPSASAERRERFKNANLSPGSGIEVVIYLHAVWSVISLNKKADGRQPQSES